MNASHEYLNSLTNFESFLHKLKPEDFHLDRVKGLLTSVGNPEKKLKIIHVAGTKGKGSTCIMIASILQQAGFKVGLYTSPHLHRINERIRILDKNNLHSADDFTGSISDEQLAHLVSLVRPVIASIENKGSFLTFFEALTAMASIHFAEQDVDFAIFETGLGGRLDATNALDAIVSVITPISLDHTKILGNTLPKIALEKAGIVKNSRQKVVLAPQPETIMDVLKSRCREFGVEPKIVHPMEYQHGDIALKGEHQIINASCALATVEYLQALGAKIDPQAKKEGLKKVRWHGRFEIIKKKPVVIVDGAHNPASAEALAKTVQDEYPRRKIILVLGVSEDKDIVGVIEPLKLISQQVILTKAKHARSHVFTRQEAHDIFSGKEWSLTEDVVQALELAQSKVKTDDVILVTGSLFVVAEARECINSKD